MRVRSLPKNLEESPIPDSTLAINAYIEESGVDWEGDLGTEHRTWVTTSAIHAYQRTIVVALHTSI